jgi:hypothetical protein
MMSDDDGWMSDDHEYTHDPESCHCRECCVRRGRLLCTKPHCREGDEQCDDPFDDFCTPCIVKRYGAAGVVDPYGYGGAHWEAYCRGWWGANATCSALHALVRTIITPPDELYD